MIQTQFGIPSMIETHKCTSMIQTQFGFFCEETTHKVNGSIHLRIPTLDGCTATSPQPQHKQSMHTSRKTCRCFLSISGLSQPNSAPPQSKEMSMLSISGTETQHWKRQRRSHPCRRCPRKNRNQHPRRCLWNSDRKLTKLKGRQARSVRNKTRCQPG